MYTESLFYDTQEGFSNPRSINRVYMLSPLRLYMTRWKASSFLKIIGRSVVRFQGTIT